MVPRESVAEVWLQFAPHFQAALERGAGEYWLEDVRQFLADGSWQAWGAFSTSDGLLACAATEVVEYPRTRILFLHMAGGRQGEAVGAMWPLVREWARSQGCSAMRFMGRKGWARSGMLPAGYVVQQDSIVYPVEGVT